MSDTKLSEGLLTSMSAIERRRFLFNAAGKGAVVGATMVNPVLSIASVGSSTVLVCQSPTSDQLVMCSVSGMQSAIGSRVLNTEKAKGYSPGYWGKLDGKSCVKIGGTDKESIWGPKMERTFPSSLSNLSWTTPVKNVLTTSTLHSKVTLGMLMANGDGNCTVSSDHDSDDDDEDSDSRGKNKKDGDKDSDSSDKKKEIEYGKYSKTHERHWICAVLNAGHFSTLFPYSANQILKVANGEDTTINRDALFELLKSLEGYNVKD